MTENRIFEKTYKDYISQIGEMDLEKSGRNLGLDVVENELIVPMMDSLHHALFWLMAMLKAIWMQRALPYFAGCCLSD